MDLKKILESQAFQQLEPERLEAFSELARQLEGKNFIQSIEIITAFGRNMPKDQAITPEEQALMMEALLAHMSENERSRFLAMMKMMETMQQRQ